MDRKPLYALGTSMVAAAAAQLKDIEQGLEESRRPDLDGELSALMAEDMHKQMQPLPVAKTNKCRVKKLTKQERHNEHRLKMAAKRRFGSGTAGAWRFHLQDLE